jgi:hypothetical protein
MDMWARGSSSHYLQELFCGFTIVRVDYEHALDEILRISGHLIPVPALIIIAQTDCHAIPKKKWRMSMSMRMQTAMFVTLAGKHDHDHDHDAHAHTGWV